MVCRSITAAVAVIEGSAAGRLHERLRPSYLDRAVAAIEGAGLQATAPEWFPRGELATKGLGGCGALGRP